MQSVTVTRGRAVAGELRQRLVGGWLVGRERRGRRGGGGRIDTGGGRCAPVGWLGGRRRRGRADGAGREQARSEVAGDAAEQEQERDPEREAVLGGRRDVRGRAAGDAAARRRLLGLGARRRRR